MNETYLIPANSKKSKLILGIFRPIDLGIFATGIMITLIFVMFGLTKDIWQLLITFLPAAIAAFLVAIPVPNYHNMLTVITNIITFFTTQRNYKWRGWCIHDDDDFK